MDVSDSTVPVEELVTAVKNAVKEADISATDRGRDLRVSSVELTLNAVATTRVGGGLDFRVPVIGWKVKVGGTHTRERTHTVTISLVPQETGPRFETRGDVEATLVEAITTIRGALAAAGGGDDPFVLDTGTIELNFAVTDEGTISVGVEGELSDEVTHSLKLGLERAG